jgi:hypothetical protein
MDNQNAETQIQASTQNSELSYRVLRAVRHKKECDIEDVFKECASYPNKQVFQEIDRLSRRGDLRLVYKEGGNYALTLPSVSRV